MASETVTVFKPYPFTAGQKIRVEGGRRSGDWEIAAVGESKITLRCPVSGREVEWTQFCYFVEEKEEAEWPGETPGGS